MIVPKYWADARLQERRDGKSYTIRRYGWSDVSQEDAQFHAEERAKEAMARVLAGEPIKRREKKASYGVEGVPIREEVVSRHGDTVVTRNFYGARCLNTPNVLFVDVDFPVSQGAVYGCMVGLVCFVVAAACFLFIKGFIFIQIAAVVGCFVAVFVVSMLHGAVVALRGGIENIVRRRIEKYFAKRELWRWRLYRTPAGYRMLVLHRTFDPADPEVEETFQGLGADKLYAVLCRKQQCFRARVSPKPWRIGCDRMPPSHAVWPIPLEQMPERQAWIERYEKAAVEYSACRFEGEFGEGIPDSNVVAVQRLHDHLAEPNRACRSRE
jgi:hypothetical protein